MPLEEGAVVESGKSEAGGGSEASDSAGGSGAESLAELLGRDCSGFSPGCAAAVLLLAAAFLAAASAFTPSRG